MTSASPGDLTHAFKLTLVYDLPFGQGRRFGSGVNGFVDRIINGWTFGLSSRIQSGQLVNLGNVRLYGMTRDEVQDIYKLRFDDANKFVYMLPQDVIDETIKAFNVSATSATGYGTAGAPTGRYFGPANGPDCIESPTTSATAAPATSSSPGRCSSSTTSASRRRSACSAAATSNSAPRC